MSQRIGVCLSDRGDFSRGKLRRVFGYEAYHWSLIILPEAVDGPVCTIFEATDASEIDPITFRMNNPTMDWWFRDKYNVDFDSSSRCLGCIIIGQVPSHTTSSELYSIFKEIPLPVKNTDPQQSCVSWAVDAIRDLQKRGWVLGFDVDRFKDRALSYGDERRQQENSREPKIILYQNDPMQSGEVASTEPTASSC